MALPDATLEIQDPGLGQVPASSTNSEAAIGVCSQGTPGTVYSIGSKNAAETYLGRGPLVQAIIQRLGVAGGPVVACPASPSAAGSVGATTHTGSGAGTVTGSAGPESVIDVKIILGGARGTATFQYRVNGGAWSSTILTVATYAVPGTLSTLAFNTGTYVLGDIYTLNLDGTVTRTGSGTATLLDASTHNPTDNYAVQVSIVTGGALGAATFKYSLDGGNTFSGTILVPGGGKYPIPGAGVILTFASTFVAEDLYTFTASTCGYSTSDATTAITALRADPRTWSLLHVVGTPANAAAAASLTAVVSTAMVAAEAQFRYARAVVECPSSESDATILAAFASTSATRVGVAVGDTDLVNPATGRTEKRSLAWSYMARLGAIPYSEHPGRARRGPLLNVTRIYRDEAATPALNDQRFVTARTHVGKAGYFITAGKMMAPAGSDYDEIQRGRVMDRACEIARAALLDYLNESVRVDPDTGFIDERDAQKIEADVRSKLKAAIVAPGHASSVDVVVDRAANILSTGSEPVTISVVPLAYLTTLEGKIGFTNPALAA